jgi:hypothetical protein
MAPLKVSKAGEKARLGCAARGIARRSGSSVRSRTSSSRRRPRLRASSRYSGMGAHLLFAATVNTGEEEWPLTSVHGGPIERDLDSVDGRLRGRRELEA